jgi:hypothetical protein
LSCRWLAPRRLRGFTAQGSTNEQFGLAEAVSSIQTAHFSPYEPFTGLNMKNLKLKQRNKLTMKIQIKVQKSEGMKEIGVKDAK